MDGVHEFLDMLRRKGYGSRNLLGMFHVMIGRRIEAAAGTTVSSGLTWRELAASLKKVRWPPEAVRELGLDPEALPPRDRERFWYQAIAQAHVDSPEAARAGDQLAKVLRAEGFVVGAGPSA
jgi:hypothetical protein